MRTAVSRRAVERSHLDRASGSSRALPRASRHLVTSALVAKLVNFADHIAVVPMQTNFRANRLQRGHSLANLACTHTRSGLPDGYPAKNYLRIRFPVR